MSSDFETLEALIVPGNRLRITIQEKGKEKQTLMFSAFETEAIYNKLTLYYMDQQTDNGANT